MRVQGVIKLTKSGVCGRTIAVGLIIVWRKSDRRFDRLQRLIIPTLIVAQDSHVQPNRWTFGQGFNSAKQYIFRAVQLIVLDQQIRKVDIGILPFRVGLNGFGVTCNTPEQVTLVP